MRRLGRLMLLAALASLGLGGCQRGHAAGPPLGSARGLAIGKSVGLAPALDKPGFSFTVASGRPYPGRASLLTEARPLDPPPYMRPQDFVGRVVMRTSLTLDLRTPVLLGGQRYQDVSVRLPQQLTTKSDFDFELSPLDPGHHCLVLTALEDARELFVKPGRVDHSSALVVSLDAGPGPDHCSAPLAASAVPPGNLAVLCDQPLISPHRDRASAGGPLKLGAPAWGLATTHGCPATGNVVLFFRDGRLVTSGGPTGPYSVPVDTQVHEVALGRLLKGSWRMVQVTFEPPGRHSTATVAPPVLVR